MAREPPPESAKPILGATRFVHGDPGPWPGQHESEGAVVGGDGHEAGQAFVLEFVAQPNDLREIDRCSAAAMTCVDANAIRRRS